MCPIFTEWANAGHRSLGISLPTSRFTKKLIWPLGIYSAQFFCFHVGSQQHRPCIVLFVKGPICLTARYTTWRKDRTGASGRAVRSRECRRGRQHGVRAHSVEELWWEMRMRMLDYGTWGWNEGENRKSRTAWRMCLPRPRHSERCLSVTYQGTRSRIFQWLYHLSCFSNLILLVSLLNHYSSVAFRSSC